MPGGKQLYGDFGLDGPRSPGAFDLKFFQIINGPGPYNINGHQGQISQKQENTIDIMHLMSKSMVKT